MKSRIGPVEPGVYLGSDTHSFEGFFAMKDWWRSRTLWFNAACLVLAAAEANLGVLRGVLPGGLYAWLAFVVPIGNALLRTVTYTALAVRG